MSHQPDSQPRHYTYADYCAWSDEERWELIDGASYIMSPAPSADHQRALGELYRQVANHLAETAGEVFLAPFDVRFPESDEPDDLVRTVVQPDLLVVSDPARVDQRGLRGAPDWIVEILSPSTALKDQVQKLALYQKHGVREYWMLHVQDAILTTRQLIGPGQYGDARIQAAAGRIAVGCLAGLEIDFDLVFRRLTKRAWQN